MSEARKFRKIPVVVEAVQWTGSNLDELHEFAGPARFDVFGAEQCEDDPEATAAVLDSLHSSWILVYDGDWIVKGTAGEYYPVRKSVFPDIYEAVSDAV